jgi:hypothetical protein
MKNTWNIIYIVVGITAIYIAIIVPSFTFWAGFGGIASLILGFYEMYKDHKKTNSDFADYNYTITDSIKDDPSKNDSTDDDLLIEEYIKSKYHVTKYQFQIIVATLGMGVLVISVIFPPSIIIIILALVIWKLYNSN